ncbi:MAG: COX15/CtaA family protein [Actinomycetota bacterium]
MRFFKPLAVASTVATFLLVAIGGLVRATKSGLGCGTDWPHCSGKLLPELEQRAQIIEFSHRAVAGIVVILLALLAVLAFRYFRDDRRILWSSVGAFGLVIFQALLGAVVVKLDLEASSVVLHLGTAMSLLALLIYLDAGLIVAADTPTDRALSRRSTIAAGSVLVLLLVGSYVSGRGAGLAFSDWPLMDGTVLPSLAIESNAIHFLHRALAAIVGVIVAIAAFSVLRRKAEMPAAARLALIGLGLFVVEVLIGAVNVFTRLNEVAVTAHHAVGAGIWASFVGLAVVTHPGLSERVTRGVAARGTVAEASS